MNAGTEGKFGYISAVDAKRHMARVEFPGDGIVSGWLPVGAWHSKDNRGEAMPDIGEHVFCITAEGTGIVLCSIYDDTNPPATGSENISTMAFADGTEIFYDRENHTLSITDSFKNSFVMDEKGVTVYSFKDITMTASGNVIVKAGPSMKLSAGRIDLN